MRASDRAYALLLDEIQRGLLAPGTVLGEAPQSERLGLSRTPVREALGRLFADGLVKQQPPRVMVVTGFDACADYGSSSRQITGFVLVSLLALHDGIGEAKDVNNALSPEHETENSFEGCTFRIEACILYICTQSLLPSYGGRLEIRNGYTSQFKVSRGR